VLVVCVVSGGMCMCVLCCMLFVEACVHVYGVVSECVCSYACVHILTMWTFVGMYAVCVLCLWVCTCMFSSNRNSLKRNVFCVSYISSMYWWNRKPNGKEFPVHPPSIPAAWCISGC